MPSNEELLPATPSLPSLAARGHSLAGLGAKAKAAKELVGEVGEILEEIKPLVDMLPGGSSTTGDSAATYSCETSVPVSVQATGRNGEEFWWNVQANERKKYDPLQKAAALAEAEAKLEKRLAQIRDFDCVAPCKRFFEVTYGTPAYTVSVIGWNLFTEVIWECTITADVVWGCKK